MYHHEFRVAVLRAYTFIPSYRRISNIFNVAPSTVCRWNHSYEQGRFPQRTPRPSKITRHIVAFIRDALTSNAFLTCNSLRGLVHEVFGVLMSRQLVSTCIRTSGMSKKKTRGRPCVANNPEIQHAKVSGFIREYEKQRLSPNTIVAIDETGFEDTSLPHMGYARKGHRLVVQHGRRSWRRTSVIAAVSSDGECNTQLFDHAVNGDAFVEFLRSLSYPRGTVFLMDNIAFHKTARVRDMASASGWTLLFTPPYSPWFDPIENVFACVKHTFRLLNASTMAYVPNQEERHRLIEESFDRSATTHLITSCFRHTDLMCLLTHKRI